ncbi:MAG: glycosyltransferase family 4 protein [Pseudonocardia sp.]|nr:glycosyltransferase family 4 protein [Pseudonocardia sp.]
MNAPVHVVVPAGIDDPDSPSGGNVYDRRICAGLPAVGRPVRELPVAGAWPCPDGGARDRLAGLLDAVPAGADVLLDGLVACGVPDVVTPHGDRIRLTVLVHLPLGDEAGLTPATAAGRAARERATLRGASAVVTTSRWAARRVVETHRIPAARVHVITPGVEPAPLAAPAPDGGRLLCVGAVTPTKGQDLLVEALARVADLHWACLLVGPLVRDPAHVADVRARIGRHGLGDRIRLTGPRTGPALAATYAAADLLVLPSRAESYGMVVTEALARGVPVVAADVDGVPEALGRAPDGGLPGELVAPGDVAALAAALRRWLTGPDRRRAARAAARLRRAGLDGWDVTARRLAGVLA